MCFLQRSAFLAQGAFFQPREHAPKNAPKTRAFWEHASGVGERGGGVVLPRSPESYTSFLCRTMLRCPYRMYDKVQKIIIVVLLDLCAIFLLKNTIQNSMILLLYAVSKNVPDFTCNKCNKTELYDLDNIANYQLYDASIFVQYGLYFPYYTIRTLSTSSY